MVTGTIFVLVAIATYFLHSMKQKAALSNFQQTIKVYKKRMGIEAMFKDCKSGGYNLEQCQGKDEPS